MSAWPSDASRYDAGQFHPEFGYVAPTRRFWSKVWLGLKGVALGALAGAVGVYFLTMEREEKARTMLATPMTVAPVPPKPAQIATPGQPPQTQIQSPKQAKPPQSAKAPPAQVAQSQVPATYTWAPVRFLPESMALPAATPRVPETMPPLRPTIATAPTPQPPSTVGASPAASEVASAPAAAPAATPAPAAPAAKAVAKPRKKIVREPPPPEPEPRTAFASPPRPFGLPIFGFGWQR